MRRILIPLLAALALVATAAGGAVAQQQPRTESISISAPDTVRFGRTIAVTGRVAPARAGVQLELHQAAEDGGGFEQIGDVATTAADGTYRFETRPDANSRLRVETVDRPRVRSAEELVRVALSVSRRVSDTTPERGTRVTFTGSVRPAHVGAVVAIQRRTRDGDWDAVARTRTAAVNPERSSYRRRITVRRRGTYRVRVEGDADHRYGISRRITIRPHD